MKLFALLIALLVATPAHAEEATYTITIKDHAFTPAELKVPANTKFTLIVKNEDASAEEFESDELEVEKIIAGKTEAKIVIPALDTGSYPFVGEFNAETAKGTIIAE